MHGTRLSGGVALFRIKILKLGANIKLVSILISVINIKVAETNASFLAIYQDICPYSSFYSYNRNT